MNNKRSFINRNLELQCRLRDRDYREIVIKIVKKGSGEKRELNEVQDYQCESFFVGNSNESRHIFFHERELDRYLFSCCNSMC